MTKPNVEVILDSSVIVFSSRTIYTEGIANRLREHKFKSEIQFINMEDDDFILKVVQANPSIIIIDSTENDNPQCCLLCEILEVLPAINIIRLKIQNKDVQVIRSSPFELGNVQDMIDLIGSKE